jgi:hypothetical protein
MRTRRGQPCKRKGRDAFRSLQIAHSRASAALQRRYGGATPAPSLRYARARGYTGLRPARGTPGSWRRLANRGRGIPAGSAMWERTRPFAAPKKILARRGARLPETGHWGAGQNAGRGPQLT